MEIPYFFRRAVEREAGIEIPDLEEFLDERDLNLEDMLNDRFVLQVAKRIIAAEKITDREGPQYLLSSYQANMPKNLERQFIEEQQERQLAQYAMNDPDSRRYQMQAQINIGLNRAIDSMPIGLGSAGTGMFRSQAEVAAIRAERQRQLGYDQLPQFINR